MRWLVRLVTPPGGLVLDPFAGSGTTGEAALLEGFRCVLIERDATSVPLIRNRLDRRLDPVTFLQHTAATEATLFDEMELA
jgi:DNA modification methylase